MNKYVNNYCVLLFLNNSHLYLALTTCDRITRTHVDTRCELGHCYKEHIPKCLPLEVFSVYLNQILCCPLTPSSFAPHRKLLYKVDNTYMIGIRGKLSIKPPK